MNKRGQIKRFSLCNFFPKNRKGIELLTEEVLKILIAVICIIILVAIPAQIYSSITTNQNLKLATATMNDKIFAEITRLNNGGEYNAQGIQIPNPSGWYLFGFTEDKKPNSCSEINCICLCNGVLIDLFDYQINECDKNGICKVIPNLKQFDKIKIGNSGTWISINKTDDSIEIKQK